jgi:hypothetical protein
MAKTEAQKKAQMKYVEKNKETYALKQRTLALNYYYSHKEEILEKKKEYYLKKKESKKNLENLGNSEIPDII